MNYNEFIQNIIDTRGQGSDEVRYSERGCERHHIIPKCLGGEPTNMKKCGFSHHENIIGLYPSEHFIAHQLLVEKYPNNYKIQLSLACMIKQSDDNDREFTPEQYEESRIANSKAAKLYGSENREEKSLERSRRIKAALQARSKEAIELHHKRLSEAAKRREANMSEEDKKIRKDKELATHYSKSDEERTAGGRKAAETRRKRQLEGVVYKHGTANKMCITNGITNKYIDKSDQIPDGGGAGNHNVSRPHLGQRQYINEQGEKKFFDIDKQPQGGVWVKEVNRCQKKK